MSRGKKGFGCGSSQWHRQRVKRLRNFREAKLFLKFSWHLARPSHPSIWCCAWRNRAGIVRPASQQQPQQKVWGTQEPPGASQVPSVHWSNPSGAGRWPIPTSPSLSPKKVSSLLQTLATKKYVTESLSLWLIRNRFILLWVHCRETLPGMMVETEEMRLLFNKTSRSRFA